jgi:hypothetical protein
VTERSNKSIERILDLSAIPSNMGYEPRADISAKWEFERFEGLITRNPHRPQVLFIALVFQSQVQLFQATFHN